MTAFKETINRWIDAIITFINSLFNSEPEVKITRVYEEAEPKVTSNKETDEKIPYDTSKFTKLEYDEIIREHNTYLACKDAIGSGFKSTLQDVVDRLNERLGKNKSRRSYARVWNGEIDRESLGDG